MLETLGVRTLAPASLFRLRMQILARRSGYQDFNPQKVRTPKIIQIFSQDKTPGWHQMGMIMTVTGQLMITKSIISDCVYGSGPADLVRPQHRCSERRNLAIAKASQDHFETLWTQLGPSPRPSQPWRSTADGRRQLCDDTARDHDLDWFLVKQMWERVWFSDT